MSTDIPQKPKKIISLHTVVISIMALLLVAVSVFTLYLFSQLPAQKEQEVEKNLAKTIQQVGRHAVLPQNETPTLLTVADPALLSDQEFFAEAQEGDKVLVYAVAGVAILYSPSKDRIITMSSFEVPSPVPTEGN